MEKPKSLFRFWFLFSWQIGQIQAWLEAMAARGWHLSRFVDFLAVFRQGPPGEVRYRCDCFKFRNPELRDKIDLYAAAGWQYLGSRGETHIFRAEDPAAPEIHTDPQEYISATTRLRRGLIVLAVALALAIPASIYRLVRDFPSWRMAIQHGSPTTWVVIALSGYSLIFLGLASGGDLPPIGLGAGAIPGPSTPSPGPAGQLGLGNASAATGNHHGC